MSNYIYLILLIISFLICFVLFLYVFKNKRKKAIALPIIAITILEMIPCIAFILQILSKNKMEPLFFENFAYISSCFLPVALLFTGILFSNTKIEFKRWYILIFIIPIVSLIIFWVKPELFYQEYSIYLNKTITGPYMLIHLIYSYALMFIGLLILIRYSSKNSGFFSKQCIFILVAFLIPTIVNVLGSFKIIPMVIYITPICFTITTLFLTIAIFKFQFLSIAPIALQKIVDRISDAYIVLDEDYKIIDFNKTFLNTFKINSSDIRNRFIINFIKQKSAFYINLNTLLEALNKTQNSTETIYFEKEFKNIHKTFTVEINNITNKNHFIGILILLKDITQHVTDLKTIEKNQEILMEKERLASLGQLIGGIAHNLKTPIMSISGASIAIEDLIKEYNASIEDPEVNFNDHHEIANEMNEWVNKIKNYTSYMSDVITAVKGQAVALSESSNSNFTIGELIKHIDILMRHELKNSLIELRTKTTVDFTLKINGNINSLVQVINNIISNSIQAYNGKTNEYIDFIIKKRNKELILSISDNAGGIPPKIKNKLFKEMVTTKGKDGTGLGLFMSYSNIRAHFDGNMTIDSKTGKGTTFNIILPL